MIEEEEKESGYIKLLTITMKSLAVIFVILGIINVLMFFVGMGIEPDTKEPERIVSLINNNKEVFEITVYIFILYCILSFMRKVLK